MKRLTVLLAIMAFSNMIAFAQKKYEMVIEKTDGTNITIPTEDIIHTYFRERTDGGNTNVNIELLYGTWKQTWVEGHETDPNNGPFEYSNPPGHFVHYYQFHEDGTFLHWGIEDGKYEEQRFDGTFSIAAGINLVMKSNYWSHDRIYNILLLDNTTLKIKDDFGGGDYEIQTYTRVSDDEGQQTFLSCPDNNHPHMIDLGLPSGTKWACCNVGADTPEGYGGYYAWGETYQKNVYGWNTYTHCDGTRETYHDLGESICGTQYDVAFVQWGNSWLMPSYQQLRELYKNCTYEWTTVNGTKGGKFTGPNGKSIFLPAAGYNRPSGGYSGYYWSGTDSHNRDGEYWKSYYLWLNQDNAYTMDEDRFYGYSVRPVYNDTPSYNTLSLSNNSVELSQGESTTVKIISGNGNYKISNSNPNVVEATLSNTTVTITAKNTGNTVITITDVPTNTTQNIQVVVKNNQQADLSCPDNHHPHMIDLGLPSGTKWACCNVGADTPEGYGGYYAWGETEEKSYYDWSTYIHCDGSGSTCHDLGSDIAGTQYDVAHVKWGGSWVMSSKNQNQELLDNCNHEWTTVNGVNGLKFTSKTNGGSIFLPAAGDRWNDGLYDAGGNGYYWSSTQYPSYSGSAYGLYFNSGSAYRSYYYYRFYGYSVRPVSR